MVIGEITYKLRALGEGATLYQRTFTSEVRSRRLNFLYALYSIDVSKKNPRTPSSSLTRRWELML